MTRYSPYTSEPNTNPRSATISSLPAVPAISVIIPVFNETESLTLLYDELIAALADYSFELLFIDDGSTDGSIHILRKLHESDQRVNVIRMRRNFGKTAAFNAGFVRARGATIVTIDSDLQDDPAEIPRLMNKLDEGFDLVCAWRKTRNDPISKRLPSAVYNWIVNRFTGTQLHDLNCGLKAYRRKVTEEIYLDGDLHRYVPVLAQQRGFSITEVPVNHRARLFGHSKYGLWRMIVGLLDFLKVLFLTQFGNNPLRLFGSLGLLLMALGFANGLYLTFIWCGGESIARRPLLILCTLQILSGTQLLSTGFIGELVRRSGHKSSDEYSVVEELN